MNAVEDPESRLQRIKLEAAVIEQHNSRLESQQENNSDKETCKSSEDSEVCNICLKYHSQAPAGRRPQFKYPCFLLLAAGATPPPSL